MPTAEEVSNLLPREDALHVCNEQTSRTNKKISTGGFPATAQLQPNQTFEQSKRKIDNDDFKSPGSPFFHYFIVKLKTAEKQGNIYKSWGFYLTSIFTILSFIGSVIMCGTDTFETGIQKIITLSENGYIYNLWQDPKLDILVHMYPFNYTNVEEVLAGKEKPKIKELGPYVFRQRIVKTNVQFNGAETLTYSENITNSFLSEFTNGSMDDVIVTPNIIIFTAIKRARKLNMLSQLTLSTMLSRLKTKPFMNISAYEFLYGYDDDLSSILRRVIHFLDYYSLPSFGFLAARDGLIPDRITIGTGVPNVRNLGMIQEYNGNRQIEEWSGDGCNNITASDGFLFPAELLETSDTVYMYRKFVCRRIPMKFQKQTFTAQGFPAKRYELPPDTFTSGDIDPRSKCYCRDSCLPSGVVSLAPCYFDAPIVLSPPHFLNGDKILVDNIIGLKPDAAKHSSFIDIHKVGVPVGGVARLQLGVVVKKSRYVTHLKGLKEDTILPIGWVNLQIGNLTGVSEKLVYHVSFTAPIIKIMLQFTFAILFLMFLTRLFVYLFLKL